jgi:hypothetical protein
MEWFKDIQDYNQYTELCQIMWAIKAILVVEAVRTSETSVYSNETTWRYIPESSYLLKWTCFAVILRATERDVGLRICNILSPWSRTEKLLVAQLVMKFLAAKGTTDLSRKNNDEDQLQEGGHVACITMINGRRTWRDRLQRLRSGANMKASLKGKAWDHVEWIHLAQDRAV